MSFLSLNKRLVTGGVAVAVAFAAALGGVPVQALATVDYTTAAKASAEAEGPELTAGAAVVIDRTTNTVIYDKNATERRYPASMTKVMCALVVLDHASLDETETVTQADLDQITSDSSTAGLVAGETLTIEDLLACLLLPSGNEAAYVLARHVAGDYESFANMMNEKAAELGCVDSHFVNPCGLHDDDHYTCAADMAKILAAAMEYDDFVHITGSATWDLPATSGNAARTLTNTDLLLNPQSDWYLDGTVTAGKTGYTPKAGRCLAVGASCNGLDLVAVVMGASNDLKGTYAAVSEMHDLLEWAYSAWTTTNVVVAGDTVGSADVRLSDEGTSVAALSSDALYATVPAGTQLSDLGLAASWTDAVDAPVEQGDELGIVSVSYGSRSLGTVGAVAAQGLALSIPLFIMDWLSDPLHLMIVIVCAVALVCLIGLACSSSAKRRRDRQMALRRGTSYTHGYAGVKLEQPRRANYTGHSQLKGGGSHKGGRHSGGAHFNG